MASGRVHFYTGIAGVIVSLPLVQVDPVAYIAGSAAGLLLTPDLDIEKITYTEGLIVRFLGRLFGVKSEYFHWLVVLLTYPYSRFKHRDWRTHFPVVSTLGKAIYFSFLIAPLVYYLGISSVSIESVIIGLAIWIFHDIIHFIFDGGMVLMKNKKQARDKYVYVLGKPFYRTMKYISERLDYVLRKI